MWHALLAITAPLDHPLLRIVPLEPIYLPHQGNKNLIVLLARQAIIAHKALQIPLTVQQGRIVLPLALKPPMIVWLALPAITVPLPPLLL